MKGITTPTNPARSKPTTIKITDVRALFAAMPKIKPSARRRIIPTMPAIVVGTRLKTRYPPTLNQFGRGSYIKAEELSGTIIFAVIGEKFQSIA
jgi:hypothetical protein